MNSKRAKYFITLWEGYSNLFFTGCAMQGLKPLPMSKDFSTRKKKAGSTVFSWFLQIGTHFYEFFNLKKDWFYYFLLQFLWNRTHF